MERHDVMQASLTDLLAQRFAATHSVTQIDASALPAWMAEWPDAVAVDASKMTAGNAAIFYASDGYRSGEKGINGRRVAGKSFSRAFYATPMSKNS